ncbi:uncharacterized protein EKO05_0000353 [Ascochyta rabiei]|uniref:uncharacterized protein n=1 Tax=Didymella rabiei TaxID=5454 RepID=UPI0021FEDE23|nr:uncharacterized protein EKO05_0000353 [Ascochyta rabiei]UPX09669.1 hypothetical protein EKO05_0000353 [Ascochyta rabiei]
MTYAETAFTGPKSRHPLLGMDAPTPDRMYGYICQRQDGMKNGKLESLDLPKSTAHGFV